MTKGLFIIGSGTDVGKTYVTALLAKTLVKQGHRAGYYKAALSGMELQEGRWVPGDAARVLAAMGSSQAPEDAVTYRFKTAVSPHLAAEMEGVELHLSTILQHYQKAQHGVDFLTVEGCGGLFCPLSVGQEKLMQTDLIQALGLPTLLVADAGLGTINATMLTCFYAKQLDIPIRAIILNRFDEADLMHQDNKKMIEQHSGLPVYICATGSSQLGAIPPIIESWYQPIPCQTL